jgi:phosphate transport system protein
MLKEILAALRKREIMTQVEDEIREMIELGRTLYEASSLALTEGREVAFDLYARDRKINATVVDVRKKIVEHLAVAGSRNVVGELVFITLINDVERIGDYSKNVLDLARSRGGNMAPNRYMDQLKTLQPMIEANFQKASKALFDNDQELAHEVVDTHHQISETCEGIVKELLSDASMDPRDGIALALASRYFKRISSHLKTIASSAVNPFSLIGYKKSPGQAHPSDDD